MKITDFVVEIKRKAGESRLLETLGLGTVLVAASAGCFVLGRMTGLKSSTPPMKIAYCDTFIQNQQPSTDNKQPVSADVAGDRSMGQVSAMSGGVVGSLHGTKWHYPWCPGAQTIKEENKVWFASEKEAEAAGYSKAGNCK
ncbi:MAG: hypothetical protein AAB460_00855 [Patescibacteria group bacterium]